MKNINNGVNSLTCRSLLVNVVIQAPTFRQYDRKVTKSVDDMYHATDSGRFNKMLVDKKFMAKYTKAANAIRTFIYTHTLPWLDSGQRIISSEHYMKFASKLGKLKDEYSMAINDFLAVYETDVKTEAMQRMGDMYDESAYCSVEKARKRFAVHISYSPVPDESDFRAMLPEDVLEDLTERFRVRVDDWDEKSIGTLIDRMLKRVGMAEEAIDKYTESSRLRNNMFEKVVETAEIAKDLNINSHPEIDSAANYVISLVDGVSVDRIRGDVAYRKKVHNDLKTIIRYLRDLNQGRAVMEDEQEEEV